MMVEAAINDDSKTVTALATQLEDEIFLELCRGGVCGFTLLHFAAFLGKHRAVQALIDLGANVNAKTQPLCVTPSQQFCRPTPLDLTVFVQNKKARELTIRALQQADGVYGGVDMSKLETVWQGLIRHQLVLIKDEVLKFTSKIPPNVRRVLRSEPRWREVIHFPGEDASAIESRRTRKALRVWGRKMMWTLIGEYDDGWKFRCGVVAWNCFLMYYSWWLFGFEYFTLLQAVLVSMALMAMTSMLRFIKPKEIWDKLPSREQVQEKLPSREQVEVWIEKAKEYATLAGQCSYDFVLQMRKEFNQCREMGWAAYSEDAKPRLAAWWDRMVDLAKRAYYGDPDAEKDGDDNSPTEPRGKKKPRGVADRIARWMAGRTGSSGGGGETKAKAARASAAAAAAAAAAAGSGAGDRQPPRGAARGRRRPGGRG